MGEQAARLFDLTEHGFTLYPGTCSLDVQIGAQPAWRAIPHGAAAAVIAAQKAADIAVKAAAATRAGASGTPGFPAAQAAELAVQNTAMNAVIAAMSGAIVAGMSQAAVNKSTGTPDTHVCPTPLAPTPTLHGPGVVIDGAKTVFINGLPACRKGDTVLEALGGRDKIALACPTVFIGDDNGASGPSLADRVAIAVAAIAAALGVPGARAKAIAEQVNPYGGGLNCGQIVDAAIARLTGEDPDATAPMIQDGTWADIDNRHGTNLRGNWGTSIDAAFAEMQRRGPGAIGLIGISRPLPDGTAHIVTIVNDNGKVVVIEGQGGGATFDTPAAANAAYNPRGANNISFDASPKRVK